MPFFEPIRIEYLDLIIKVEDDFDNDGRFMATIYDSDGNGGHEEQGFISELRAISWAKDYIALNRVVTVR